MKRIFIDAASRETRVAIQEDGQLVECYVEPAEELPRAGNIYRGRVANVLAGMQAAFVDIGWEENAYLYIDDALPPGWRGEKGRIRDWVQQGEFRLVQVTKEALGGKAPRVTTNISLPGRRLVYLPFGKTVSVSRRIVDEQERLRLQQVAEDLLAAEEGAILRTLADGASAADIASELAYLRAVWQEALEQAKAKKAPGLVYSDVDLALRVVRDAFAEDVDELIVEGGETCRRIREMVRALHPALVERVSLYQGKEPLFAAYGLDAEIDKALARRVWLPSGGFLVIDRTEALTVIDVNTGKFTGRGAEALEETATRTNVEAAREIARQLRLRDIGGIIVIDFIDMEAEANRARVLEALERSLKRDRTSSYVVGLTRLGLVEMTRKKVRRPLADTLTRECPSCHGRGRVLSDREAVSRLERDVRSLARCGGAEAVLVEAHPDVATAVESAPPMSVPVFVRSSEAVPPGTYRIVFAGGEEDARKRVLD